MVSGHEGDRRSLSRRLCRHRGREPECLRRALRRRTSASGFVSDLRRQPALQGLLGDVARAARAAQRRALAHDVHLLSQHGAGVFVAARRNVRRRRTDLSGLGELRATRGTSVFASRSPIRTQLKRAVGAELKRLGAVAVGHPPTAGRPPNGAARRARHRSATRRNFGEDDSDRARRGLRSLPRRIEGARQEPGAPTELRPRGAVSRR